MLLYKSNSFCPLLQLIADYEEQGGGGGFGNGDGASTCSTGTASPDIFHSEAINGKHLRGYSLDGGNDVVVTPRDIATGMKCLDCIFHSYFKQIHLMYIYNIMILKDS